VVSAYIIAITMPRRGSFAENQEKLDFGTKISDFFYYRGLGRPLRGSKPCYRTCLTRLLDGAEAPKR
jgi:hypothetical protein